LVSTVAPCSRCRAFRSRCALPLMMRAYISSDTCALGPLNSPRATTSRSGAACSVSAPRSVMLLLLLIYVLSEPLHSAQGSRGAEQAGVLRQVGGALLCSEI